MWKIRPAREDDAAALSELAETTFRVAFAARNAPADMDLHCARSYAPAIQAGEIRDPHTHTLLAVDDSGLVGYAQLRRGTPPPCVTANAAVELRRFYLRAAWHGSGLAHELMTAVRAWATAHGDVLWLGVWEENPRAIAFYRKLGFTAVGDQVFVIGTDPQRDLVMTLPLDAPAPPPA